MIKKLFFNWSKIFAGVATKRNVVNTTSKQLILLEFNNCCIASLFLVFLRKAAKLTHYCITLSLPVEWNMENGRMGEWGMGE